MLHVDLSAWQERHGFTTATAAKVLGLSRTAYFQYLHNPDHPKWLALACKAIDAGLDCGEGIEITDKVH